MKRFYKLVTASRSDQGYHVHLDGKPVKTPAGKALFAPTMKLAEAIAAEWRDQEKDINPETMPLTQLLTTALDRKDEREAITAGVMNYLDTDLLCYRTETPADLAGKQAEMWDPWLSWFEKESGVELETTTSLMALKQPQAAHDCLREQVEVLSDLAFFVMQNVTALSGSVILAFAFIKGALDADAFYEAVMVEDHYKAEIYDESRYGTAPHEEKKRAALRTELEASRLFLVLAGS